MDDGLDAWQTALSADGPKVAEWFDHRLRHRGRVPDALERRLRDWRAGSNAEFWSVDRWTTALGLHVSDVPEEIWLVESCHGRNGDGATKLSTRHCEVCGKPISKRTRNGKSKSAAIYLRARFCCLKCQRVALSQPKADRQCTVCGQPIPRRQPGGRIVSDAEYSQRAYCSRACTHQGQLGKGLREFVNGAASR